MRTLLPVLRRLIYQKRHDVLYRYPPSPGAGRCDRAVVTYSSREAIPTSYRDTVLPHHLLNAMYYRLGRGTAQAICLSEDGETLQAYGWLQAWGPFRRRFGSACTEGTMLGPFWTAPAYRKQGLYGRLLQHSVYMSSEARPLFIYASPDNVASRRGIESAGFEPVGEWVSTSLLTFVISAHRVP